MDFTERLGYRTIRRENGECELELQLEEIHMSVADRASGTFFLTDTLVQSERERV